MTLLAAFMAHELKIQLRSPRFRVLVGVYVLASSALPVVLRLVAARVPYVLGPSAFAEYMDIVQPLLTAMLAAAIAVDAVNRERDEGSLLVVSLAPISAAGYVIRRWIAVLMILVPVTLLPRLIAYGLAVYHVRTLVSPASFLLGWTVHVLPVIVMVSALALALGTISGRTVLALIFGFLIFTMVLGFANNLLAYAHRNLDGFAEAFGIDQSEVTSLMWTIRGWRGVSLPTEAGYPFVDAADVLFPVAVVPFAVAAMLLGISCLYLRRTRPDVRAWRVRDGHPLRNFVQIANRMRDHYAPDAGRELTEQVALAGGAIVAAIAIALLIRRYDSFAGLAGERYAAEKSGPAEMSTSIVPESVSIRGEVESSGRVRTIAELTLRNHGLQPLAHLGFFLNAAVKIEQVRADAGSVHLQRRWERVGVDLDPPLPPNGVRRVAFTLAGTPGVYDFALYGSRSFQQRYHLFLAAKTASELSNLSRSHLMRAASGVRALLRASDLTPVPRYTPWTPGDDDVDGPAFVPEAISSSPQITVRLKLPRQFMVADACGTIAPRELVSGCTMAIDDYVILGAPLESIEIAPMTRLAFLPAHAELARTHAPSLAGAIALAREAWPHLPMPARLTFVERPSSPGERYEGDYYEPYTLRSLSSFGAMNLVPELMFIRKRPLEQRVLAASLITNSLKRRRTVVSSQKTFFSMFYRTIALARLGERRGNAVVPPVPGTPITNPILDGSINQWNSSRLRSVLADVEYRVGSDRLIEGISEFVDARGGEGTAKELLDTIGRRGNVSLDRVYRDYFIGSALPRLTLTDVTFTRDGARWVVHGKVRNDGKGEAFCPMVLRTSAGTLRQIVHIDSDQSVAFTFTTEYEPRTVQLDPEKVCYRFGYIGSVDSADYRGQS